MNVQGDEWRTLVLVPAVVALVVNLFTPLVQRLLLSMLALSIAKLGGGAVWVVRVRVSQIDRELAEMRRLATDNTSLLSHYRSTVFYLGFGLWVLLLAPLVGIFFEALAAHFARYLPGFYAQWFSIRGAAFISVVGAAVACGPLQAAAYSLYMGRRLQQLSGDAASLFERLEAERRTLLTSIEAEAHHGDTPKV